MAYELIFDTETTGLIDNTLKPLDKQPHVIEFYGMLVDRDTFEIKCDLDLLIKPPVTITPEITKITTITNEMVADAPVMSEVCTQILDIMGRADRWVAHNLAYDLQIMKFEAQRLGKTLTIPSLLCTVEQTEFLKGHRLSLSDLHEYLFGETFKGAHRAKVDVQALYRCYVELRKRDLI